MIKAKKIASVCFVIVLMASLFLISGVNGAITSPILPPINSDSRTTYTGNSTMTLPEIVTPNRYEYTQIVSGQIYDPLNNLLGKYGALVAYDYKQNSLNDISFFPSLAVKATSGYYISEMKITVTGTKPDGQPISGIEFTNVNHLITPESNTPEWAHALTDIANIISPIAPAGIAAAINVGTTASSNILDGWAISTGTGVNSAWTRFYVSGGISPLLVSERGFQCHFKLHCDPDLPGDYTINVQYEMVIRPKMGSLPPPTTKAFDQQITYEFRAPPKAYVSKIEDYSYYGSAAGINNPNYLTGNTVDGLFAHLHAGDYGDQAVIIGRLNTQKTGRVYLYGYSTSGYFSHLLVYVSYDGNNWGNPILNAYVWTPNEEKFYIDCGLASNINYIAIAAYDDLGWSAALNIDAVCIYNY
jgi:hypothetical protein